MNTPNPHDPLGLMKFAECSHDTLQCTQCHARSDAFGWQLFAKSPSCEPDESITTFDTESGTVTVQTGIYTTTFKSDRLGTHAAHQISVLHSMLHSLYTKLVQSDLKLQASEALELDYQAVRDRLDTANARFAAAEAQVKDYGEMVDQCQNALCDALQRLAAAEAAYKEAVADGLALVDRLDAAEADALRWRYVRDNSTLAGETQQGVYLWEWEALDMNPDSIEADVDASIEAAKGGRDEPV